MFDCVLDVEVSRAGASGDEDWFDPASLEQPPAPEDLGQIPASQCAPSGWLALELDHATVDPGRPSDADLIDTIVGFDRVVSWAGARQAELLAEFARRRPAESGSVRSDVPSRWGEFAADEIGLALRLSRTTASARLTMAEVLVRDLPATLAAWRAGRLDALKARTITETSYLLAPEQRGVLEQRVLPRAEEQPVARLRAALVLARAVLAIDPDGAEARYQQRRLDRRVVVSPDMDGMASLWALLSTQDATAAYERLSGLARELGAGDPRSMDARRADLLVDLLTGRHCTSTCHTDDCCCDGGRSGDGGDGSGDCDTNSADKTADADPHETAADAADAVTAGAVARRRRGTGPGKPLVSVTVPITTLLGLDDHPGDLAGHGPVSASVAREIAAEGTWRRLLTDPVSGTLLDCGRTTYTPPAGLADFVRARDVTCRFPTCGQPAHRADLDHTVPYGTGPTSANNLASVCRHHHRAKTHAPGWHVEQRPDGQIVWNTPTGHAYTSHPYDYRPDPPRESGPLSDSGLPADPDPPPF